jgi:hypothetical protein
VSGTLPESRAAAQVPGAAEPARRGRGRRAAVGLLAAGGGSGVARGGAAFQQVAGIVGAAEGGRPSEPPRPVEQGSAWLTAGPFPAWELGLGVGLVINVIAASTGISNAQSTVLHDLYGIGTDLAITKPAAGSPRRRIPGQCPATD